MRRLARLRAGFDVGGQVLHIGDGGGGVLEQAEGVICFLCVLKGEY